MTPKYLSAGNSKLQRDGILSFGIPAYKSQSGKITCPGAKDCIVGCYARNGFYLMPVVKESRERNLALTETAQFIPVIHAEIRKRKVKLLRIHDSGDFYSKRYLNQWLAVIAMNPDVQFYAYTKMKPLFDNVTLPSNFKVIFSFGGKFDSQIDVKRDRHSVVFDTKRALIGAGYADVTEYDLRASGTNHRIGLVYHGPKSKAWESKRA